MRRPRRQRLTCNQNSRKSQATPPRNQIRGDVIVWEDDVIKYIPQWAPRKGDCSGDEELTEHVIGDVVPTVVTPLKQAKTLALYHTVHVHSKSENKYAPVHACTVNFV